MSRQDWPGQHQGLKLKCKSPTLASFAPFWRVYFVNTAVAKLLEKKGVLVPAHVFGNPAPSWMCGAFTAM